MVLLDPLEALSGVVRDAAKTLADPAVARAFDGVQQQAKDVCPTPLSL